MKKVFVTPGCISCGACQANCPEVFQVRGTSQVKEGADLTKNADLIKEVAEICPVNVIKFEE